MSHPLRIGFKISAEACSLATQRATWRLAEEEGFDHFWGFDHLVGVGKELAADVFEGWSLLAAMAQVTKRVRMGLLVTGNMYRHPALLAKIAATVDHLSDGRLEMGFGAGWNEAEFHMFGMDCPPLGEQISRFAEACVVLERLWHEPRAQFEGKYYSLRDAISEPKPLQRPHPPLWIGGSGNRVLRITARHADVWNTFVADLEKDVAASQIIDRHCEAIGRDPGTIRRSLQLFWNDADATRRKAEGYVRAGFSDIILTINPGRFGTSRTTIGAGVDPLRVAEEIAKALPSMRELA